MTNEQKIWVVDMLLKYDLTIEPPSRLDNLFWVSRDLLNDAISERRESLVEAIELATGEKSP